MTTLENVYNLVINAYKKIDELQDRIDRVNKTVMFKHSQTVLPSTSLILYEGVELDKGQYIIEASCTYGNIGVMNETGVILGLYENEKLIGTGSAAWYSHQSGDDIYSSYQTIYVKCVFKVENKQTYHFVLKPIGLKNSNCITFNTNYPCILTIF